MNAFKGPVWLHVSFMVALALAGVVTSLVGTGQLQLAAPIMAVVSMLSLMIHSVDPTAVALSK